MARRNLRTDVGFAVGYRSSKGTSGLLAALGLVAVFAYSLSWIFVVLGLQVSDPEAAQGAPHAPTNG